MLKSFLVFTLSTSVLLNEKFILAQDQSCTSWQGGSISWGCCNPNSPCGVGGGDCDRDRHCLGSLKCGNNNCATDFPADGNWDINADCCYGKKNVLVYKLKDDGLLNLISNVYHLQCISNV